MTLWKTNYVRKVDLAIWGCGTDPQVSLKKCDVGDMKRQLGGNSEVTFNT